MSTTEKPRFWSSSMIGAPNGIWGELSKSIQIFPLSARVQCFLSSLFGSSRRMGRLTARDQESGAQISVSILSERRSIQDHAALRLGRWLEIRIPPTCRLHANSHFQFLCPGFWPSGAKALNEVSQWGPTSLARRTDSTVIDRNDRCSHGLARNHLVQRGVTLE